MEYKDYYKILGVDRKASQDDIKHAYRRLARKFHPDVSKEPNAEEQFKNVQEAYEVLKDPEKRTAYDQLGSQWKAGQEFRPPPGWESAHTRFYTSGDTGAFTEGDFGGDFSDFFSSLFGGGRTQTGFERDTFAGFKRRGSDQHARISISLEDAFRGTNKTIQLQVPIVDENTGHVSHQIRTIKVNIPAGATQGQQLRLAQQGNPGIGGAPAGDLYLEIDIEPHPIFSLEGKNVYLTLPVTPWEAALGADIRVPTLAGKIGLKLPAATQTGQKLRLKEKGMPGKPHAGDQFVVVQIKTPPAETEEQRQLYQKMAQIMPFNPRKDWAV
ncbi:DnaJ C-terminal domain-containing protein [Aquicella lusitana]|uniref:Curved DNA-binding protein n=1 Tax=Aquicella lusitana TaxID=254246 RepID=A0A370GIQ4_9COXI|nr:DnaJ C-terminal domain-containing protein [Aquicella lusitana]RDI41813.1 curved DNA-binding protein [Aquicella lusitana]VVC73721.1 Curved DNA-binding protein [Aquicella lusitana]